MKNKVITREYPWGTERPVFVVGEDEKDIMRDIHLREIHYCLIKYMAAIDRGAKNVAYCNFGKIIKIVKDMMCFMPNDDIDSEKKYRESILRTEMGDELYEKYIEKYLKK